MVSSADESKPLTHIGADGEARMVDVSDKAATDRVAIAEGRVRMAASTLASILAGDAKKGDVIGAARIAGIMAAKKTADLIPLCHALSLTKVSVDIAPDEALPGLEVRAEARCVGPTGVEMEALTAVSVACLTIYDMAKAIDRGMSIEGLRLIEKRGGKSGEWRAEERAEGQAPMSQMITVEEALKRVLASAETPLEEEKVALELAYGRVLARDLKALRTQPPFPNSAMDGYALRAADTASPPATLTVVGESAAGRAFEGAVGPGEAVRIFTGAPMPDGADAIVIQEDVEREGERIRLSAAVSAGDNLRAAGMDFRAGEALIAAGRRLTPRDVALAAAANHTALTVRRRAKVAILATGDELVAPGGALGPAQIVASNNFAVAGIVEACGGVAIDLGIAVDELGALKAAVSHARKTPKPTCW